MAEQNTMTLGGLFPVITFDKLPDGMEKGNKGRAQRTKYEWGGLAVKQGIKVPGDRYNSAMSSATTFAQSYPHDEAQEKKIAQHLNGKLRAAKAAAEKEGTPWTEDMEKAITADPAYKLANSRAFRSEAVKDDKGQPIRSKGLTTSGGQKLADEYYIIRTN